MPNTEHDYDKHPIYTNIVCDNGVAVGYTANEDVSEIEIFLKNAAINKYGDQAITISAETFTSWIEPFVRSYIKNVTIKE